jgi:hypothetical protein
MDSPLTNREEYYVQRFARNALAQMAPAEGFVPPEQFLTHIGAEEYTEAFMRYRQTMRDFFMRIIDSPGFLDLTPISDGRDGKAAKKDEAKARAAFMGVFNIISAVSHGKWKNGEMLVDYAKAFQSKIAVELLKDAGFTFAGLSQAGDKIGREVIRVGFPSRPAVLIVINSFYGATADRLALCDWKGAAREGPDAPYGVEDAMRAVSGESSKRVFQSVDDAMVGKGFTRVVHYSGFFNWTVKYFHMKSRKETAVFHIERDDTLALNIRPLHVAEYAHRFDELNDHVRGLCLNGADCRRCGYCQNEYRFVYRGREYVKCQIICGNFHLHGLGGDDIDSVLSLLEWETGKLKAAKRGAKNGQ